jgi:surfactin synthase thioesterase subunit/glycosyltransferase involved in cell wall biosynthesis
MRILLASNAQYFPAHGGGERSNRMVIEALAKRGHTCLVITRVERFGEEGDERMRESLRERNIDTKQITDGLAFELGGIPLISATHPVSFRAFFTAHKDKFAPDVIITSTDDPAQLLLEAALEDAKARTVFLARATVALSFGPDAAFPSREKTDLLREADGVICVSDYVASYVRQHSGIAALHVPIALPEPGPHPKVGRFDNEFVTLVNPCAVKGLSVFLELAKACPHLQFAAVPTWGTTAEDRAAMEAHANVTILPKVDRINDLFSRTRVLLVPSLWAEARSRIVVEAMLAGVPALASKLGGLPEAKMHVPYILPVRPIDGYTSKLNEQMVPVANVPPQPIEPWRDALERLTKDRSHWEELSALGRSTTLHYAETTTVEPFERFITSLQRKSRRVHTAAAPLPSEQLKHLSPERRRLLEIKLRKQAVSSTVEPVLPLGGGRPTDRLRVFCFPHAGGGASAFRGWREQWKGFAEVASVQYPGHENRRGEPFVDSFSELVYRLKIELRSSLIGPFLFFGHSMGATVAFELARQLEADEVRRPVGLIVSSARAPLYRLNHRPQPEPQPDELLSQLRRLGGLPIEAESNPRFLETVLPALTADTRVYRNYVYQEGPPLPIPILAVGGESDPQVDRTHLDSWRHHTSARFGFQQFPGGHFYLRAIEQSLLEAIAEFCTAASGL